MEPQSRRTFLARTVEGVSALPLVYLIGQNFVNRTSYYQVDDSLARISEFEPSSEVVEFSRVQGDLRKSIENPHTHFRQAYHKSHTRIVMVPVSNGKTIHMSPRVQTYYTWEEPANLPNHATIEQWNNSQGDLVTKVDAFTKELLIDLQKLEALRVRRERTDVASEGLVSAAIYVPQIVALLFYEEAIAKMRHGSFDDCSVSQLVEENDTPNQITRRSWFKVGAALVGAYVSSGFTVDNTKRREEGRVTLLREIEELRNLSVAPDLEVFQKCFETSSDQMIGTLRERVDLSRQALATNIGKEEVRDAFAGFVEVGDKSVKSLENLFSKGVPKGMGDSIKSVMIARRLADKSLSEHRAVYSGLGLTGLAVAGAIAGVLVPLEIGNEIFANCVEKRDTS